MTTPRIRSLVSVASALALIVVLGACSSAPMHLSPPESELSVERPVTVRFDNDARDYVHVYLIGERREWLLGRVEAGARATLRIPAAALADDARSLQLAVLVGQRVTVHAAGEARATIALAQPADAFRVQRWWFSTTRANGQLTALPVGRPR